MQRILSSSQVYIPLATDSPLQLASHCQPDLYQRTVEFRDNVVKDIETMMLSARIYKLTLFRVMLAALNLQANMLKHHDDKLRWIPG